MYGGTTREDPDTVCVREYVGGSSRDCVCEGVCGRNPPEYSGILSIPDTLSVKWYVWGNN